MSELESEKLLNPFLRWTGSKRWFTKDFIEKFLPEKFNNFHEPFLGGGAVFFYLKSQNKNQKRQFFISDTNSDLINCYLRVMDDVTTVIRYLKKFKNTEQDYYKIRASKPRNKFKKAAQFIYLNRTSFNGIYRVNSNGVYNVPYGKRYSADVVTEDLLKSIHSLLQGSIITSCSFENSIQNVQENDLVFIDPPYTVAHENNGFIEYNQTLFSWEDQLKLKEYIIEIKKRKAFFILTNACHKALFNLYGDLADIQKIGRLSKVGGRNKTRGIFNEIIVSNTKESHV